MPHNFFSFNEATRVQIPALVHLTRLGYEYVGKISKDSNVKYDSDTNILIEIFENQFKKLNPNFEGEVKKILEKIRQELNFNDIGKAFYKRLVSVSEKLIDFENIENNVFHFTAEFTYKNGNEEFRPDITLFVNGLPLVFIEVKIPNNEDGMIAERKRLEDKRYSNSSFRRFFNITQLMIFSNNMEYPDLGGITPIEGAFYATAAKDKSFFNYFREEPVNGDEFYFYNNFLYKSINPEIEKKILADFNSQILHNLPEYQRNLEKTTPTNRIITSMCSPERLLFLIKYGIAYVNSRKEEDEKLIEIQQKHIMRYQQMFALLALKDKITQGIKSGIIWHSQGSGKTALSYYLTKYLSDYFASKNQVAKFYFIVDRIDLLEQAKQEFEDRGLSVKVARNRAEFTEQFRKNQSKEGNGGNLEITVANIQKFDKNDKTKISLKYGINLQRVFIIDEAHRGYKIEGTFLSNLLNADKDSIKIALTGTPLLNKEQATKKVFGNYIHTYYYNKSVNDGYTLKIIREDIEVSYRQKLMEIYDRIFIGVEEKDIKIKEIIEHKSYVSEFSKYIISDLNEFRKVWNDKTLGAMIVCESAEQARKIYEIFDQVQDSLNEKNSAGTRLKAELVLHNAGDKETRKKIINNFKKNMGIDVLIVFKMLLTGFDAPRLKRLYLAQKLQDHTLLQAITRVNRPYGNMRYGYVIDFADIKKNFEETNKRYLNELANFNNDEINLDFNDILEDKDKLLEKVRKAKNILVEYKTTNLEDFVSQISGINQKRTLLELKKILIDARDAYNIVRSFGNDELKEKFSKIQIVSLSQFIIELQKRIKMINQKEAFESSDLIKPIFNLAMLNFEFSFNKNFEEELDIVSKTEFEEKVKLVRQMLIKNSDFGNLDPKIAPLIFELIKRMEKKGFSQKIESMEEYYELYQLFKSIYTEGKISLNKNQELAAKYNNDAKFVRIHKAIREENQEREKDGKDYIISQNEYEIVDLLNFIKENLDKQIYDNKNILNQPHFFDIIIMTEVSKAFKRIGINGDKDAKSKREFLKDLIKKEYLKQLNNKGDF
ncbi:Type I restriction enzyme EcoR124II R protein [Mesomycoplasma dispar]|uniref:Type I restriction enzyme endonuclease subunit n=1 Tax=Mesomycoplasma dispar TaxID=86660 RepID=A0AAJ5NS30_9BACT|nr:HsdR family type I site-specific deoxyribonuclease [Mesomycoplasma dispar]AJR11998.1 deoxyribonuclease HsdR [Mesomycoplasma dispar]VEU61312.1 Type I restriction enzyme EcoR124II R protein [Mesomycoplasma dispar]